MDAFFESFRWLYDTTGLNLTIVYDAFDHGYRFAAAAAGGTASAGTTRHELPGLGDGWQMVGLAELPQAMHFLEAKDHIGLPAPLHGPPAYAFCSLDQAALPWNFKTD